MTYKILLVLTLLFVFSSCKKYQGSFKFSQLKEHNGWHYLEKFRFAAGVAKFETELFVRGKAKTKSQQIYIQAIPEAKWEEEQVKKCDSSVTMPVLMEGIRMTGQKKNSMFQFSVSEDTTYYFVVKDCHQMYRKDYDNEDLVMYIKFHAFSNLIELPEESDALNEAFAQTVQVEEVSTETEVESEKEATAEPVEELEIQKTQEEEVQAPASEEL